MLAVLLPAVQCTKRACSAYTERLTAADRSATAHPSALVLPACLLQPAKTVWSGCGRLHLTAPAAAAPPAHRWCHLASLAGLLKKRPMQRRQRRAAAEQQQGMAVVCWQMSRLLSSSSGPTGRWWLCADGFWCGAGAAALLLIPSAGTACAQAIACLAWWQLPCSVSQLYCPASIVLQGVPRPQAGRAGPVLVQDAGAWQLHGSCSWYQPTAEVYFSCVCRSPV